MISSATTDLTGSFRLAGDCLRCLTRCNTNANTAANTGQRCNASAQSYQTTHSSISFVITVLNVLFIPRRRCSLS